MAFQYFNVYTCSCCLSIRVEVFTNRESTVIQNTFPPKSLALQHLDFYVLSGKNLARLPRPSRERTGRAKWSRAIFLRIMGQIDSSLCGWNCLAQVITTVYPTRMVLISCRMTATACPSRNKLDRVDSLQPSQEEKHR